MKAEPSLEPFRMGHPLEAGGLAQLLRLHTPRRLNPGDCCCHIFWGQAHSSYFLPSPLSLHKALPKKPFPCFLSPSLPLLQLFHSDTKWSLKVVSTCSFPTSDFPSGGLEMSQSAFAPSLETSPDRSYPRRLLCGFCNNTHIYTQRPAALHLPANLGSPPSASAVLILSLCHHLPCRNPRVRAKFPSFCSFLGQDSGPSSLVSSDFYFFIFLLFVHSVICLFSIIYWFPESTKMEKRLGEPLLFLSIFDDFSILSSVSVISFAPRIILRRKGRAATSLREGT